MERFTPFLVFSRVIIEDVVYLYGLFLVLCPANRLRVFSSYYIQQLPQQQ